MNKDKKYPIFPKEKFNHGDFKLIANLSGRSYSSVVKTLMLGSRSDKKVIKVARQVVKHNEQLAKIKIS